MLLVFLILVLACGFIIDACRIWIEESRIGPILVRHKRKTYVSRGEAECGRILQQLFPKHKFVKVRPPWLLHAYPGMKHRPRALELDFYCSDLRLAVEYQGEQHSHIVPKWHGWDKEIAREKLALQQQRDAVKEALCKKHGIDLIQVWWQESNIERFLTYHPMILERL